MTETKQAAGGRTVHLALVQFESVLCDPAANTQKACRMIAEAAAEGADLVVLPELFSTGYELNIVGPHVPELARGSFWARTTSSICGRSSASTSAPAATARCSTPTSGASA